MKLKLRNDWYKRDIDNPTDLSASGIYEWRIAGVGVYVGKALKLRQRISAYPNNVRRMIDDQPWHGNPGKSYRPIHDYLLAAYQAETPVSVAILETCDSGSRNERERFWINQRRVEHVDGGLRS